MSDAGKNSALTALSFAEFSQPKLASNRQKQLWEKAFWHEQRQLQMAQDSNESMPPSAQHKPAGLLGKSSEAATPLVNDNHQHRPADVTASNFMSFSPMAESKGIQATMSLPISNTAYSTAPVFRTVDTQGQLTNTPTSALLPKHSSERMLATGLVQINENQASIWLGDASLKHDRTFLAKVQDALHFFGLKLKRLIIHGKQVSANELPVQSMRQKGES